MNAQIKAVPVANEPDTNAVTLADIRAAATPGTAVATFVDAQTPEGHFGVATRNIGGLQVYWLRGAKDDENARSVARTQVGAMDRPVNCHYIGGGILGGRLS